MMTARSIVGHTVLAVLLQSFAVARAISQTEGAPVRSPIAGAVGSQASANSPSLPAGAPVTIQLDDAITRALANQPAFAAAAAQAKIAKLDRSIARAALLPSAVYSNQFLYTQGGAGFIVNPIRAAEPNLRSSSAPRFIANNAVHEYISQGSVTETIGPQQFNAVSKASAGIAIANAELEIARRGLVATVVGLYYNSLATGRKVQVAQRAADEAASFTKQTQQRETAREVAHADVVKAQLLQQQRERDLADAKLNADKARLDLAVLLFPDPREPYTLAIADTLPAPPSRADVEAALAKRNPELQGALASSHLANLNVTAARLAYLPDLALNYNYGLDAAQFAMHNDLGADNLGYSASAALNIPLWDWFTTRDRIRQAKIQRETAHTILTNTQRRLIADLEEFYSEATVAHDQLASLNLSADTAAESLRLTRLRYSNGEATVLEVVDAETSLTTAENAREDGIARYQNALANLQMLTGTL
ncbi:MAG TPA: TolC family protein [Acidobacteriaceae bacterium]